MARIRRIPYTKPLPPNAELFTKKVKGQEVRYARFRDKKGNPVESKRLSPRRVSGDGEEPRRGWLWLLPCDEPRSAPAPSGRGRLLRPAGRLSVPRRRLPP
jgi:hypothetical protein